MLYYRVMQYPRFNCMVRLREYSGDEICGTTECGGQQVDTAMLMDVGAETIGPGLEKAPAGIRGLDHITAGGLQVRAPRQVPT
jgi:hypothetical protein